MSLSRKVNQDSNRKSKKRKQNQKKRRKKKYSGNPTVIGKDADSFLLEDVQEHSIDRGSLTVYLQGEKIELWPDDDSMEPGVEYMMANKFRANMNIANRIALKRQASILVDMSTTGGDWVAGMTIANAILDSPVPVTIFARGEARSMSSIIPLFADKFVMSQTSMYMFHRGTFGFYGLDQQADTDDSERRKCTERMIQIYLARLKHQGKYSGWSIDRIRKEIIERPIRNAIDVWHTAEQAVSVGFAHEVYKGDQKNLRATEINHEWREVLREVLAQEYTFYGEMRVGKKVVSTFTY